MSSSRSRSGSRGKGRGKGHGRGQGHGHGKNRSRSRSNSSERRRGGGNQYGGNQYGGNQHGGNQYGGNQYGGNQYGSQNNDDRLRQEIDSAFAAFDQDGTGTLSESEFEKFVGPLCQKLNRPPPQSYDEFINIAKSIDTNYDGKISKAEIFNVMKKMGY